METGTEFFKKLNDIKDSNELADYIFEKLEIQNNPKRDALFTLAYMWGHSAGNEEIWNYAVELVDLIN